jgi:hypothetical protein
MTIEEITTAIRGKERMTYTTSTYTMVDDVLVRISNHLPKECNFYEYDQQNVNRVFFIFAECNLTQREIESYLEKEFANYNFDFMIVEENDEYSIEILKHFIQNF